MCIVCCFVYPWLYITNCLIRMSDQGRRTEKGEEGKNWCVVPASDESHHCINLIRSCVENDFTDVMKVAEENQSKRSFMNLSIGKVLVIFFHSLYFCITYLKYFVTLLTFVHMQETQQHSVTFLHTQL